MSSEAYLEQATFRLKNYNQARYHFDDPTEYSERIRHLSGVLDYRCLVLLALIRKEPGFGNVQTVVLKGKFDPQYESERGARPLLRYVAKKLQLTLRSVYRESKFSSHISRNCKTCFHLEESMSALA